VAEYTIGKYRQNVCHTIRFLAELMKIDLLFVWRIVEIKKYD
jgi:hypothetical protein